MTDWNLNKQRIVHSKSGCPNFSSLVPRVLWRFGQQVGTRRDSGISVTSRFLTMEAVVGQPISNSPVSPGAHPLTKKARGLWVRDWNLAVCLHQKLCDTST